MATPSILAPRLCFYPIAFLPQQQVIQALGTPNRLEDVSREEAVGCDGETAEVLG